MYIRALWEADCDTHHYLVVAKIRERLAVSELEVRKQYQIEISKRFAGLENFNDTEDIHRDRKT